MEIVDQDQPTENLDQEFSDVSQQRQEAIQDELPEKYRGKSPAEIARMHQEAEKALSRQGQEAGELRRLADQLIQQSFQKPREAKPEPTEPELDEVDFFADPKAAVARAVASHPAVVSAQQAAVNSARQEARRALQEAHPDFQSIIPDPDFQEFVSKSKVRQQLFIAADRNYDYDAANELLSTYKELRGRNTEAQAGIREAQDTALRAASNPAVGGSSEPQGKKIYRRSDLIKLRMTRPDEYEAREPEIMRAYAEGRVR